MPTTPTSPRRPARGSAKPPSGDATGREAARQRAEAAPAIAAAALTTTMVNPPPVEETDVVIDATDGGGVREIDPDEIDRMLDSDTEDEYGDDDIDLDDEDADDLPDGTVDTRLLPEPELDEPKAKHGNPLKKTPFSKSAEVIAQDQPEVVQKAFKMMQVNEDVEDVTIGQGNTFTFREGTKYRVTQHVYNHLDEKGLVRH